MKKVEVKYGLCIGIGIVAWILLEFALGFHTTRLAIGQFTGYAAVIIPITFLYQGMREKRDTELAGQMKFGQGVRAGFLMSLVAAPIVGLFFYVFVKFLNPHWLELTFEFERAKLLQSGVTAETASQMLEQIKPIFTVQIQVASAFFGTILQGASLSILISALFRWRQRKQSERS
ncbi:hypothetical protein A2118_01690 [Candidatus Kaiserbacteria bacterium GWA2_50_9]|uniref:DUF4199 domain-containing protein n=1 Tax=Candidatus Kaiserbacteria bacterium GWA2_50_9 TaxID=1798474 RepID=A0A1F6BVK6_9BACT|nr:MAG: hypothetical protein A2118_01690 [Candidatus Kaiserbacteria bacterium GWA2_50_9]